MIDLVLRALDWLEAHPAVGAVAFGWVFGISVTQAAKRYYPLTWSVARVKRTSQALASIAAGVFAWRVWPATNPMALDFALLAGMACPVVYTLLKALLPQMLKSWGWTQIAANRAAKL